MLQLLNALFGGGTPANMDADDYKAVTRDLGRLDKVEKDLGQRAIAYVCSGHNESALASLTSRRTHVAQVLGYDNSYSSGAKEIEGRNDFFLRMRRWDATVVKRYGEVLVIAVEGANRGLDDLPGTEQSPSWFRALLLDVARMLHVPYGRSSGPAEARGAFSVTRLKELLALDGNDVGAIFDIAFDHRGGWQYWYADRLGLTALAGFADLLREAPSTAIKVIAGLPVDNRAYAIRSIAKLDMIRGAYFDLAFQALTDSSKKVREAASAALHGVDPTVVAERAQRVLSDGKPNERLESVRLAGSALGDAGRAMLEQHLPKESSKKIVAEIEAILRHTAMSKDSTDAPDQDGGYRAADGSFVSIPPMAALPPDTPVPDTVRRALRDYLRAYNEAAERHNREKEGERFFRKRLIFRLELVDEFCALMASNAAWEAAGDQRARICQPFEASQWMGQDVAGLARILADPGITLWHLLRAICRSVTPDGNTITHGLLQRRGIYFDAIHDRLAAPLDLRMIGEIGRPFGLSKVRMMRALVEETYWRPPLDAIPVELLWPCVAESLLVVDEALGLTSPSEGKALSEAYALDILAVLPKLPAAYLGAVLDRAVGERKALRAPARALLANVSSVDELIIPLLESAQQEVRIVACDWLIERNVTVAIAPLRKALAKEKQEAAKAAILTALARLGDNIETLVSQDALLAEAEAGLKKVKPKDLDWFPFDGLPRLRWRDGKAVDPVIVRWWIVLANKLRQPGGNPLFEFYLDRLEPQGAEALGATILQSFVTQDTIGPTEAEASEYARANAQGQYQASLRWNPDYTYERAFAELRAYKLGQFFGSANDNKGILGLAARAKAVDAVAIVRAYMRDHYPRTAQCKALVECLSANPSPTAIQFVLSIANRYRTKGVKEHAGLLVQAIADRRGWSPDQLADRTIPTAGMDEAGTIELPIGERVYGARLDEEGKVALLNPEGRVVQSLPSVAEGPEAEAVAAAKKTLSTARKEIKQVQEFQQRRLYESLCTERRWQPEEWENYLLRHPIVGRLVQRLIWAGLDDSGAVVTTFRPLEDLTLTDASDNPVGLQGLAAIRLAHRCLLSAAEAEAWQRHLADYKVTPLLEQLKRPFLTLAEVDKDHTEIIDRRGWLIETFKLRGLATKLSYVRGQPGDGGFFTEYVKTFDSQQISAVIEFTGNNLPEENRTAALRSLYYVTKAKSGAWRQDRPLPLSKVPAVLLSETWNDLHAMAEAGTGFADDWEKRAEW